MDAPAFNIFDALGIDLPSRPNGTPKRVQITVKAIDKAFRVASRHCHPDKLDLRAPGTRHAFPTMGQLAEARDFLVDEETRSVREANYWKAVRTYRTRSRPFDPSLAVGDPGVFDLTKEPNTPTFVYLPADDEDMAHHVDDSSSDDDMGHGTDAETDEDGVEDIPQEDSKSPRSEEAAEYESEFESVDEDELSYGSSRSSSDGDSEVDETPARDFRPSPRTRDRARHHPYSRGSGTRRG